MAIISIPTSIGGINIPGGLLGGPLGALYKTVGMNYTKYPSDLESSTRSHVVMFTISEIKEVTAQAARNYANKKISDAENLFGSAQATVADWYDGGLDYAASSISGSVKSSVSSAYEAGKDWVQNGNIAETATAAGEKAYEYVKTFTTQETIIKEHIALYMPDSMAFSYSPEYDSATTLASAAGALPLVGGVVSKLTNTLEGNDAVRLALNKMGYVFNPQRQMLFKGIDFRTFQMSFTFTPYSRDEAESVKKIIQTFRSYAAPTIVTEGAGMFFKPPGVFDIEFKFNGAQNQNLPKIKRSVITNVEVNYAPNGWATHTDGAPVQTTMNVDFQEMVLVDKTAIDSGY